jgi:hypothetical protein
VISRTRAAPARPGAVGGAVGLRDHDAQTVIWSASRSGRHRTCCPRISSLRSRAWKGAAGALSLSRPDLRPPPALIRCGDNDDSWCLTCRRRWSTSPKVEGFGDQRRRLSFDVLQTRGQTEPMDETKREHGRLKSRGARGCLHADVHEAERDARRWRATGALSAVSMTWRLMPARPSGAATSQASVRGWSASPKAPRPGRLRVERMAADLRTRQEREPCASRPFACASPSTRRSRRPATPEVRAVHHPDSALHR